MELSIGIRLVIIFPTLLFLTGCILKGIIERKNLIKIENELKKELPTLKKIVEKKNFEPNECIKDEESLRIINESFKLFIERFSDFFFVFGIESIFLFLANSLIIIFELQQSELGVASMIIGIMLSLFLLVGIYSASTYVGLYASIFGYVGVFGLLGGELAYLISFGTENMIGSSPIENVYSSIGIIVGIAIALSMGYILFPETMKARIQGKS